jgi:hypothetical protein
MKLKSLLLAAALLCGLSTAVNAQSNDTFFASAFNYFTSFNTNYTWSGVSLEMATGVKQVNGVSTANTIDAQYDLGNFNVGVAGQLYGVGAPFNVIEGQVGYAIVSHYDAKLDADLRAGYDNISGAAIVEPTLMLKKKLTPNTFASIGVSVPWESKGKFVSQPTYYVEAGFTY